MSEKFSQVELSKKKFANGSTLYLVGIKGEGHDYYSDKDRALRSQELLGRPLDLERLKRL